MRQFSQITRTITTQHKRQPIAAGRVARGISPKIYSMQMARPRMTLPSKRTFNNSHMTTPSSSSSSSSKLSLLQAKKNTQLTPVPLVHFMAKRGMRTDGRLAKYQVNNLLIPESNNLPCYRPAEGRNSKKGVVVIQEWWGMNVQMGATADFIASKGFHCVVPDLYRSKVAKDFEHAGHLMNTLDWSQAITDIKSSVKFLQDMKCSKVGIVGFCMGGALTIASAANMEIDAGVCFHGIPDLNSLDLKKLKAPLQMHFGEADQLKGFSDLETAKKVQKLFSDAGVKAEWHFYPKTDHAFTNQDRPEVYNAESARLAWDRTFKFLNEKLA